MKTDFSDVDRILARQERADRARARANRSRLVQPPAFLLRALRALDRVIKKQASLTRGLRPVKGKR